MTQAEKLEFLKAIGGSDVADDSDDTLNAYIQMADDYLVRYIDPFSTQDPSILLGSLGIDSCKVALYWLNKRGAEGQLSHNENSISRSYENADIAKSMLRHLVQYGRVMGGNNENP